MVMYMFQCYSLISSHPLLPSLCPKVCPLCLHLFCSSANRMRSIIFLDSIHMYQYTIFLSLFLTYVTLHPSHYSLFIHLIRTDSNAFFLLLSNMPLYIGTSLNKSFLLGASSHLPARQPPVKCQYFKETTTADNQQYWLSW